MSLCRRSGSKATLESLFLQSGSPFVTIEIYLSKVMGHGYQRNLCFYFAQATQVEATEAHIVLNVAKATFDLCTASLF